ncbi:MAG: translation initiation factor IF-1 [Planctomycetes bacterium]|nr:translation initiation factor IF-1 [Planctomycetota bacterium]
MAQDREPHHRGGAGPAETGSSGPSPDAEPGRVLRLLPNRLVFVELDTGENVTAHVSGPMRVGVVRLLAGDRVLVERSPFDASKGRIVGRANPPA